jgi:outer membrane protein TolC
MIFTKKNSKNFPIQSLLHILVFFAIAGCKAVGPDYEGAPEMDVPENWNNDLSNEFVEQSDTQKQWWTLLDDPILNDLIDRACY